MGTKYYITGVQVGMLLAYAKTSEEGEARELLSSVLEEQELEDEVEEIVL